MDKGGKFDVTQTLGDLPESFYKGLARLLFELNVNGSDFSEIVTHYYLKHAFDNSSEKKSLVHARTGISRRKIEKYFNDPGRQGSSSTKGYVYSSFINEIKAACLKSPNMSIPLRGIDSFEDRFNNSSLASGHTATYRTVLNVLTETGQLLYCSKTKSVSFVTELTHKFRRTIPDVKRQLGNLINEWSLTQSNNIKLKPEESPMISRNVFSESIPAGKADDVIAEINAILLKAIDSGDAVLEGHDDKDSADLVKVGFHLFTYKN